MRWTEITEAFDNKTPISWDTSTSEQVSCSFEIGKAKYIADFNKMQEEEDTWDFEFESVRTASKFSNTNELGASSTLVFSAIIDILKTFIGKHHPEVITFSGDKNQNRLGVYSALLKKFSPQLASMGYQVTVDPGVGHQAEFKISRR
jgi:hypothetical protein